MHLAAAASWGFLQSINNPLEGVAWGVLLAVTLLRLPKIGFAYGRPLRDPAWLLLILWMGWLLLSVAWAHPEVDRIAALRPMRWLLTPLLLWPVMGYPWLLLGAVAAGGLVQACAAIGMSIGPVGVLTRTEMRSLTGFGQLQTILGSLFAISLAALAAIRSRRLLQRTPFMAAAAAAGFAIVQTASRAPLLAAIAGMAILLLRPRPPFRFGRPSAFAATTLAVLAAATIAGVGGHSVERLQVEFERLAAEDTEAAVLQTGSHRGSLWLAAWELGWQSPLVGHGRRSFGPLIHGWAMERAANRPELAVGLLAVAELNHAHNSFLNAWVEGGLPAVALLAGGLALLSVRVWRQSAGDPAAAAAAALLAIVLVGTMVGIAEAKAGGALIAVAMAISWRPTSDS